MFVIRHPAADEDGGEVGQGHGAGERPVVELPLFERCFGAGGDGGVDGGQQAPGGCHAAGVPEAAGYGEAFEGWDGHGLV